MDMANNFFLTFLFAAIAANLLPCHAEIVAAAGGTNVVARVELSPRVLHMKPGHHLVIKAAWEVTTEPGFGVIHFVDAPASGAEPAMSLLIGGAGFVGVWPATSPIPPERIAAMNSASQGGVFTAEIKAFVSQGGAVHFRGDVTEVWPTHTIEVPAFSEAEALLSGSISLLWLAAYVHATPTLFMVR